MSDGVSLDLSGRVALVTGGVRGLGLEIAKGFARAGATVALHGRDRERVHRACESVPGAIPVTFDLGDAGAMRAAVDQLARRGPPVDILVANAAIRDRHAIDQTGPQTLREVLEINLVSQFELARLLAPGMVAAGWGRIIFITSVAAIRGSATGSTYAASKGGVAALMRSLAVELGPHGICVNAIGPGFFATEHNADSFSSVARDEAAARIPLGRWGEAKEIVGPALLLASEAGAYINGHHLIVDGGLSVRT